MIADFGAAVRLLCGPLVDEALFRAAHGAGRGDLNAIRRHLQLPVARRPRVSVFFDPDWYVARNAEAVGAQDPLLHFLGVGLAEWRDPHPLIELRHIAAHAPSLLGDLPAAEPLAELLHFDLLEPSPYFDLAHYATQLDRPVQGLLGHYLTVGAAAGLSPNAYLDAAWYAGVYADAPQGDRYAAMRDFVYRGDAMARSPGPGFDGALYWRRYTDVADARSPPLRHFLSHGLAEGRQAPRDRPAPPPVRAAPPAAEPGPRTAGLGLPIEPAAIVASYATLAARLAAQRQARKDAVVVRPPPLIECDNPVAALRKLRFDRPETPRLSILIPMFEELAHTAACLTALAERPPATSFEVVVADDGSTDPAARALGRVEGLVVLRTEDNHGFIRACNAGFARCRGEYVLLLNNDAQPLAGAVDALVAALDADPGVGAAGPKLLYPNGRLQEAGCFIRPNGESGMVGLFADPADPEWNTDRDVTYCSGAALMVRRALVGDSRVGPTLFDEAFVPAYCEDADLCLRLIAAGARVRYVHGAEVVHHLSVSTNRQRASRKHRRIVRNQKTLGDRWGERLRAMDRVRALAFYLPQFHPTPENDLWWGQGFTEWTNVARARPSYAGHYQPHLPADLGYYDLRVADSLRRQADLAARYGVEGFCVYHYSFGERRMLAAPMRVLAANPDIAFRHCLCWANENWTRHWDGGAREILLEQRYDAATLDGVVDDALRAAADPRYITVDGAPVVLVYRPLLLPDAPAFAAAARAAFGRAGHPGLHLVYVESMEAVDQKLRPADIGFDAAVEFPPHGRAVAARDEAAVLKDGWTGYRYDYADTVMAFLDRPGVPYTRYPAVFPSWDNTPRQPLRGTSFDGATPELFQLFVEEKIEEARRLLPPGDGRLLFVNAWNEWAEGAHLEPDSGFGHRWLEALCQAQRAKAWA